MAAVANALLRDDADLLRQRRAAHRARLHDGRGRRRWPAGGACGATTSSSSPAPTSTASRSSGRRRSGGSPPRSGPTARASGSARPGRCSTSPTPTSSAPPSPATTRRSPQFLQRVYDNGYIELDTYEGLYCVHCEAYYAEDELIDGGSCPIHDKPVDHVTEENYFFRLSRFTDRAARALRRAPRGGAAREQAQRGARLHQAGPARLLDEPHVDLLGHPAARGIPSTSPTCGSTRCSTTAPRSATATTARASTATGRSTTTSSARTSSGSTRCSGPRC